MIVNDGKLALLRYVLRNPSINTTIHLFKNDVIPTDLFHLSDLIEATFSGYAAINSRDLTWPDPTVNGDDNGESDGPNILWTCSAAPGTPEDIHGIYVVIDDGTSTPYLFFAFRFAVAITITLVDDVVEKRLNWFAGELS